METPILQEKLFVYLLNKTVTDYVIEHVTLFIHSR